MRIKVGAAILLSVALVAGIAATVVLPALGRHGERVYSIAQIRAILAHQPRRLRGHTIEARGVLMQTCGEFGCELTPTLPPSALVDQAHGGTADGWAHAFPVIVPQRVWDEDKCTWARHIPIVAAFLPPVTLGPPSPAVYPIHVQRLSPCWWLSSHAACDVGMLQGPAL